MSGSSHSIIDDYTSSILNTFKNQTSIFAPESKSLVIY